MKFILALAVLPALSAATSCSTPDGSGTCMLTSSCSGFSVAGYCPGSADNQCCISTTCSTPSGTGVCLPTSDCKGTSVAGHCPGPSNVQCCVGEGCSTPSGAGVCMVSSSCTGKSVAGYCPGPSNFECCVGDKCSTPSGSGTCQATSSCSGTSVAGYCPGPSSIECCVASSSGGSCSTPDGSGTCMSTSSCTGFSVAGYCPGSASNQCCIQKSCSTSSGSGTCKNTSEGCSGGSFVAGACPGSSDIECCVKGSTSPPPGGNLPGLDSTQTANAKAVIAENQKEGLGKQGCEAAISTALTESKILILANPSVPASENYPNNGDGTDHDSIGIFQQRASIYTDISCDMDAACSASQFFKGMTAISGWQTMDVAALDQAVQKSADPDAYEAYVSQAASICAAAGVS